MLLIVVTNHIISLFDFGAKPDNEIEIVLVISQMHS